MGTRDWCVKIVLWMIWVENICLEITFNSTYDAVRENVRILSFISVYTEIFPDLKIKWDQA